MVKIGRKNSPHVRKSFLDHDSGIAAIGGVNRFLRDIHVTRLFPCSTHVSQPAHSQACDTHTYTLTIFRDFKISKIRARQEMRTVETSLACAYVLESDYVLESN